jgi:sugar-specific transcriptional regulator TrmB
MAADDEFIRRLIDFGLSGKEAQLYLYLLKYGPKTPSPLAKSLKTYREDVHRTLTSLIDKGMVRPSLETPTVYTAVDLETALESALKRHESELREMAVRKLELQELAQQQAFRPSDEVPTFKIIRNVKELVTVAIPLLDSMKEEWFAAAPGLAIVVASLFGITDALAAFIQRGGKVKNLVDISYPIIDHIQELLSIGSEVRHIDQHGVMFTVSDRKYSLTAIRIAESASLSAPLSALYTDDPIYAKYLKATFEMLWQRAVPAEERIEQLLNQGPPRI